MTDPSCMLDLLLLKRMESHATGSLGEEACVFIPALVSPSLERS
jgi:hypothetical protein